jgi:ribonuclease HII
MVFYSQKFKNYVLFFEGMIVCGIDEAGRGPVIGPMVICGVVIDEKDSDKLVKLGVKDSKLLTPQRREELFSKIISIIKDFKIEIVSPDKIDTVLNDPYLNLNWLEALVSAKIINQLKPDKVILDCPSPNLKAYSDYVRKELDKDCIIVAEHKADVNYPVVSAASILAKVTRDAEIEKIKKKIGVNFGSGYPADPVTKEFLKNNYNKHPEIFRKTWSSYKAVVAGRRQKSLGEF